MPRLLVNRVYYNELPSGPQDKQSKAWLNECLQSANWLMKALDQRARTIVKVASEIVTRQDGFFRHGVSQLKPLTLRAVAEAIGMHESTVSRVTSNKYLSCERGLFELKYFFTSGIQSNEDGGEAASSAGGEEPDQGADRRRGRGRHPLRRHLGRHAEGRRLRHRPAHGRQISRGDRAGVVGAAAAAEGDRAGGLNRALSYSGRAWARSGAMHAAAMSPLDAARERAARPRDRFLRQAERPLGIGTSQRVASEAGGGLDSSSRLCFSRGP